MAAFHLPSFGGCCSVHEPGRALAIARDLQARSGWSLKKIIRGLRPLQQITIQLAGQQLNAQPAIPDDIAELLAALGH